MVSGTISHDRVALLFVGFFSPFLIISETKPLMIIYLVMIIYLMIIYIYLYI